MHAPRATGRPQIQDLAEDRSQTRARSVAWLLVALLATACSFDTRIDTPIEPDASLPDASPPAPTLHLLLSEIKTSNDILLREFIEVFNPTEEPISLGNYYLADTSVYARLPAIVGGELATVDDGDFIARFPSSPILMPGRVITVAIQTSVQRPFATANFAVASGDGTASMLEAFSGSIPPGPNLSNDDGEGIALFLWDQSSDLVTDVDLFNAGFVIFEGNELANKSGIAIDGPDAGDEPTAYATDAYSLPLPPRSNGINEAFVRVSLEVGETQAGGNGIDGHDETTEDTLISWDLAAESPGVAPAI